MRIRKTGAVTPTKANIVDSYNTSTTDGYSANYINEHSVIVSPTEPSTDRKKVWLRHSDNFFPATDITVNQVGTSYSINVKPNTAYTLSYTKTRISGVTIGNQSVYDFQLIRYFNSSGTQISQETSTLYTLASGGELNINKTFTTPANTAYVTINLGNNNGDNNNNTLVSNIMLNKGSTALPYEPYASDKEYILNDNDVYEDFDTNNDTGLVNVSLNSGFTGTLTVRKVGKTVNVIGTSIAGNFVGGTAFATIPEGFRPPDQINYVGRNVTNESMFLMNQNSLGAIRSLTSFSNATLQFSFTYLVD